MRITRRVERGRQTRAHDVMAPQYISGNNKNKCVCRSNGPKDSPVPQKPRLMLDIDNNDCIPTCFMLASADNSHNDEKLRYISPVPFCAFCGSSSTGWLTVDVRIWSVVLRECLLLLPGRAGGSGRLVVAARWWRLWRRSGEEGKSESGAADEESRRFYHHFQSFTVSIIMWDTIGLGNWLNGPTVELRLFLRTCAASLWTWKRARPRLRAWHGITKYDRGRQ